jgi:DNA-binding CsgD family transcriptional regulator
MAFENTLWELTRLIYAVAMRSDGWTEFSAAARRLFQARACSVAVFNFQCKEGLFHFSSGYRREFVVSYENRYSRVDVWLRHESDHRAACKVHVGRELVSDSELVRSNFYREWLEPQNFFHRLSAVLVREKANLCYFAMLRSRADRPFGANEARALRRLAPHLRSAVQLCGRLAMVEGERDAALEVLNHLPIGVVLCDENGKPIFVNHAGKRILSTGETLTVRSGRLSTHSQAQTEQLNRLIGAAAAATTAREDSTGSADTLAVPRRSGLHPVSVLVSPLRASPWILGHNRIAAAIFISDPTSEIDTDEGRLSHLYGLTRAESRLAAKIAEGRSLEEAAAMLNITTETARSYIKRVLSKTGAKRQSELVRLLLLSPACFS